MDNTWVIRDTLYPKFKNVIDSVAIKLDKLGFTPNQLTLAGLVLNFVTGWIYATGNFFLAGLFLMLASLGDLLDGALARATKKSSKFGAFLDSTIDRYSDFFLFGGLALFFAREGQGGWFVITVGILGGAFVTSYAKARAENFIKSCQVALLKREDRIALLMLGSLLPFLMPLILWILLIGTHATAIQRILYVQKELRKKK